MSQWPPCSVYEYLSEEMGLKKCMGGPMKMYGGRHLPLNQSELTEARSTFIIACQQVLPLVSFHLIRMQVICSVLQLLCSFDQRKIVASVSYGLLGTTIA